MIEAPAELMTAFWAYETALMRNDTEALDRLFAPGPHTLRADAAGLLVGHDQISEFRASRGGAPQRKIVETHVQVIDEANALILAITELERGGRGQQTQLWKRLDSGWAVTAAHVSVPAPAFDTRVWRVTGDPLVRPTGPGPLDGHSVAVKDLYAVAGFAVGAGNPSWLAGAPVENLNAWAVQSLLGAGASIRGIARTDEFAYSLAGTNAHYGTPPNPRAPYRISGGSTSGSATAVSFGQASIGLGTDTGGSIRIPAAYQGLFGIRTTHDAIPRGGLMPLAASFDTVGWLTQDAETLRLVGSVLLPDRAPSRSRDLVAVTDLLQLAEPDVASSIGSLNDRLGIVSESWPTDQFDSWRSAFVTLQAAQAWQSHRWWLGNRLDTLGADVRGRFENAAGISERQAAEAAEVVASARQAIVDLVADRIVVLPSAPTTAPLIGSDLNAIRLANLQLTCVAGLAGLPAVSLPLRTVDGLPCGVCLIGAPGRDLDLLDLAVDLAGANPGLIGR